MASALDTSVKLVASVGAAWFAIEQIGTASPAVSIGIPLISGLLVFWLLDWLLDRMD